MHCIVTTIPQARKPFWRTFMNCAKQHPPAARIIVSLLMLYLHLGAFSRQVMAAIDRRIAEIDREAPAAECARGLRDGVSLDLRV